MPRQRQHGATVSRRFGIRHHLRHVDADVGREVGLVDDEEVGAPDTRAALASDIAAARDIQDEDLRVDQSGRERRCQVVAAGLDEHDVERREVPLEVFGGEQVGGDVIADRGVRARAGLDGADALGVEHAGGAQEPGILVGVDVVRDDAEAQFGRQARGTPSR